jgi:ABC-type multidrug transport system ATPase subunit
LQEKSSVIKVRNGSEVDGLDVITQTKEMWAQIGYLPKNTPPYPHLFVGACLRLIADMQRIG